MTEIKLDIKGKSLIFYDFESEFIFNQAKKQLTRPIEIAIYVETIGDDYEVVSTEQYAKLITYRPGKAIKQEVTEYTGITQQMLDEKGEAIETVFSQVNDLLLRYPNKLLIGHNIIPFDTPILNYRLNKYGFKEVNLSQTFDTAGQFKAEQLGWKKFPNLNYYQFHAAALGARRKGVKFNLGLACERYNVVSEGWHRAMNDVMMVRSVFYEQYKLIKENDTTRK